jgi:hypothetical protein
VALKNSNSGAAPRCCKPDDFVKTPLCGTPRGKVTEKEEGEPEDRPKTGLVFPGVGMKPTVGR